MIDPRSNTIRVIKNTKENKTIQRADTTKQSDKILQNILNASKLLEGRITFEELIALDIPTFESLINNEFANIDRSAEEFKTKGIVNAYSKDDLARMDQTNFLKQLEGSTIK